MRPLWSLLYGFVFLVVQAVPSPLASGEEVAKNATTPSSTVAGSDLGEPSTLGLVSANIETSSLGESELLGPSPLANPLPPATGGTTTPNTALGASGTGKTSIASPNLLTPSPGAYSPSSSPWVPPIQAPQEDSSTTIFRPKHKDDFYARVDYFYWQETSGSQRLIYESGAMAVLGYRKRNEWGRLEMELFGNVVDYHGETMDGGEPLSAKTGYFGMRAEYDLPLMETPSMAFYFGVGTRIWNRQLRDSVTAEGDPVVGYNEVWWTVFPCIRFESWREMGADCELFASATVGFNMITSERISAFDVTLRPKVGPVVRGELGIRKKFFYVSSVAELSSWGLSPVAGEYQYYQPKSMMATVGLEGGFRF